MKSSKVFSQLAFGGIAILISLILFTTTVEAQCPPDIPDTSIAGTVTTPWIVSPDSPIQFPLLCCPNCFIDIYFCERAVQHVVIDHIDSILVGGRWEVDTIYQPIVTVKKEFYVSRVDIDPLSDSSCDNVSPVDLVRAAVDDLFQFFPANPCSQFSQVVSVSRMGCWTMIPIHSHGPGPQRYYMIGCQNGSDILCTKTCEVCFDNGLGMNRTIGCYYQLTGGIPSCTTAPPTWLPNVCYHVPCE